jgi:Rap1a immunity proteins
MFAAMVAAMRAQSVLAAALFLLPSPALCQSDELAGQEVYRGCLNFVQQGDEELFYQGVCVGTIDILTHTDLYSEQDRIICPPQGASFGQAAKVVVDYMDAHSTLLHLPFRRIAIDALYAAWPCQN